MNRSPEILIASHAGTDFDSLASMAACHKIYPDAQPVFVAGTDENVREFMSLYGDVFDFANLSNVDITNVHTLIITDTGQKRRLGNPISGLIEKDNVKVVLFDHHLMEEKDFHADEIHQENFGAATTVVLNELMKQQVSINPMEATLFALGIYEDTGSLTYSSTTPRDLEVVAELLRRGARLDIVTRFLTHQLEPPQRQLLQKMLLNVRQMHINGRNFTFTTAKMGVWVKELALLTHKVSEMENADVIFSVVEMKDKLYIVGRSRLTSVNVSEILGHFGGGGHHAAASAAIPGGSLNRILPSLIDTIRDTVSTGITAADIMSSPVLTVDPDDPIDDAYEKMLHYGHSGLLVINKEDGNIAGLISRKDIDKALSHNLGHAPIKSVMTKDVITVNEGTTIDEMQELIIEKNIGRLPVMFGGKLKGIVTRSDVLRAIHMQVQPDSVERMLSEEERKIVLNLQRLAPVYRSYIEKAGQIGDRLGYQVFLVGGIVRDLILGRENLDIDFLVEGSGQDFASEFGREFNAKIDFIERFSTAKVHVSEDAHVDIAMCRCEYYRKPGALPDVAPSGLRDDLYRRDFTINALAVRVNPSGFGELIDFFRGANDLQDKRLRTLHPLSFVDDPTRIFRAIRFEGRLGFTMDSETSHQARVALDDKILKKIAPERIRHEIELILKEDNPCSIIQKGNEIGIWQRIHESIEFKDTIMQDCERISGVWRKYSDDPQARWRIYLPVLFMNLRGEEIFKLVDEMNFDSVSETVIKSTESNVSEIESKLAGVSVENLREYVPAFSSLRLEILVFLFVYWKKDERLFGMIENYMNNLRNISIEINGNDLIELGHKPSPLFKQAFNECYFLKLEGRLTGRDEELEFAHEYLSRLEKEASH